MIAGIVLAAGESRRMGTDKMLLRLGGGTLLRRAAATAASAGLSPVVTVLGQNGDAAAAELHDLGCQILVNPASGAPSSTSLHLALRSLSPATEAAVILLGDMPFVTAHMVETLLSESTRSSAPLIVSRYGGVQAPPLLFRHSLFPELLGWHGEGCGKAVVRAHAHEAVYLDWDESALADVDTPADFERARTLLGG